MNPLKNKLSNGDHVYLEITELGNRYLTDEIGGGAVVWDTAIVSREAMLAALMMEMGSDGEWLSLIHPDLTPEAINEQRILFYLLNRQLISDNAKLLQGMLPEHIIRKYADDILAGMESTD